MTNSANINMFHVKMWLDLIEHLGFAPHMRVNVSKSRAGYETNIPKSKLIPGTSHIILNVSANACGYRNFDFDGGHMMFSMRFNGRSYDISLPVECIEYVFANAENAQVSSPFLSEERLTFSNHDGFVGVRIDNGDMSDNLKDDENDQFADPCITALETNSWSVEPDTAQNATERTAPVNNKTATVPPKGKPTLRIVK